MGAPTFASFTDSTNTAEAVAGRYGQRTATEAFRRALRDVVGELEHLLKEGTRVHGAEALQWIPRRFNTGADHLAKEARRGDAWWMHAFPQGWADVDIVACTDAGVCVQEGCATQGGYLLVGSTQECIAMWRERRTLEDGEVVDVNAEEAFAVKTALELPRLARGRRWGAWRRTRLAIVTVPKDGERRTVRKKHKESSEAWARESVEARRRS